ncbi:MAG TPA: DUF885 domain-containing protein [Rhodanobacteraceae bacterium]|nr:DUF885 domain-containing protein [Rhodanobacteraceae bacterium]
MYVKFSRRVALALLGATAFSPASAATGSPPEPMRESPADVKFKLIGRRWLAGMLQLNPVAATEIGDHRYDHELDDLSPAGRKARTDFQRLILGQLATVDRTKLARANQVDAAMLENRLKEEIWHEEAFQDWAWDPDLYHGVAGDALYLLMARDFAPLPDRLRAATSRMRKLPALFEQARAQLDPARVPAIHAQTVAKQNKGLHTVNEQIVAQASALPAAERKDLQDAAAAFGKAVDAHQEWLDKTLVPNAKGDFRIGAKLYDEKLVFALDSPMTRAEIRQSAEAALAATRARMYEIARGVLTGHKDAPPTPANPTDDQQQAAIAAALELAYADRPDRHDFVPACERAVKVATDFVRTHDLITLPSAPVKVVETPKFKRGVSGAYCSPPGPLDKGQETFVAVDPIPDDWTDAQASSYLREYNSRNIDEVIVHEAMPGHYVQLWHANQYPSVLRAVLASGPFVEGWACYAEDMMADEGFLDRDPLYLLVHLKLDLRSILNAILDQGIHVDNMSRDEAMHLMTVKAFQQDSEAAGKWIRAQLSSCQLPTYFVGLTEHHALRAEAQKRWGKDFSLKRYHDTVTSFGSPPVRYVRALMFDEPIG